MVSIKKHTHTHTHNSINPFLVRTFVVHLVEIEFFTDKFTIFICFYSENEEDCVKSILGIS